MCACKTTDWLLYMQSTIAPGVNQGSKCKLSMSHIVGEGSHLHMLWVTSFPWEDLPALGGFTYTDLHHLGSTHVKCGHASTVAEDFAVCMCMRACVCVEI